MVLKRCKYLIISWSPFSNPSTLGFWHTYIEEKTNIKSPIRLEGEELIGGNNNKTQKRSSWRGVLSLFCFAGRNVLLVSSTFCLAVFPLSIQLPPGQQMPARWKWKIYLHEVSSITSPETLPFGEWQVESFFSLSKETFPFGIWLSLCHILGKMFFHDHYGVL